MYKRQGQGRPLALSLSHLDMVCRLLSLSLSLFLSLSIANGCRWLSLSHLTSGRRRLCLPLAWKGAAAGYVSLPLDKRSPLALSLSHLDMVCRLLSLSLSLFLSLSSSFCCCWLSLSHLSSGRSSLCLTLSRKGAPSGYVPFPLDTRSSLALSLPLLRVPVPYSPNRIVSKR